MKLYEDSKTTRSKNACSYCSNTTTISQTVPKFAKTGHIGRSSRFRLKMVTTGEAVVIRSIGVSGILMRDVYAKQQAKKAKGSTPWCGLPQVRLLRKHRPQSSKLC